MLLLPLLYVLASLYLLAAVIQGRKTKSFSHLKCWLLSFEEEVVAVIVGGVGCCY